ncbi:lipase [Gordonia spumicola]|uniref:Lipase n=1 Tax=Gordonia spumicola TaxID=589161 RepID=A0A7I9V668_9ACTN|nr:lipase family protein [Gordonia spumicola]GEE00583.1 lipase [Gordonia spumicola]
MTRRLCLLLVVIATVIAGLIPISPARAAGNAPGTVISVTQRPAGWRDLADGGRAVTYWTQDSRGRPVQASGALMLPSGTAPAGGWPVVAYTHGTSGYGPGCGGQSFADASPDKFVSRLIDRGYAVVASDYVGLGPMDVGVHPYLDNRSEASATIDLLNASRSIEPRLANRWGVAGGSQGGQAALATAHRQRTYGPRSDFRGTVAVDPESDVEKIMPLLGPYIPPVPSPLDDSYGFLLGILAGLRQADPSVNVDSYLTPYGRRLVDQVGVTCRSPILPKGLAFGRLLSRPLGTPAMTAALNRYMAVAVNGYDAPILLILNTLDTTVPSPLHASLVAQFAANRVNFSTSVGNGSHTQLDAAQWAAFDRFFATRLKR